ncbi:recombination regulator RecX [Paraburkholderia jirisanensis]
MIRKGRPVSDSGRDAGGPFDPLDPLDSFDRSDRRDVRAGKSGDSSDSSDPSVAGDSFDPFESFDAHDRAAGRGPSARSVAHGASGVADGDAVGETVYTRSRRSSASSPGASSGEKSAGGAGADGDSNSATKRQRPTRSLKGRALGFLSRREYSRAELSRKLAPYVEEGESLDAVLDALQQENWLSDSRFTESLVHRRASRLGAGRIVGELKRHAVSATLIEETAAQLRETELARAQAVWRKKYGQLPETPAERAKQARFLMSRGFSQTIIVKILKGIDEDFDEGFGGD